MIGDVAGHDMQAAAVMGKVRTAVRVLASQATGPGHFLEMLCATAGTTWSWSAWPPCSSRTSTPAPAPCASCRPDIRLLCWSDRRGARFADVKPTTPLGAPRSAIHEWRGTLAPEDSAPPLHRRPRRGPAPHLRGRGDEIGRRRPRGAGPGGDVRPGPGHDGGRRAPSRRRHRPHRPGLAEQPPDGLTPGETRVPSATGSATSRRPWRPIRRRRPTPWPCGPRRIP